jgi:small conductance mechanosensitive channel
MEEELQTLQKAADLASEIAINYGFQFFAAIVILLIGWQISRWVSSLVMKLCDRLHLDITLSRFFAGLTKTTVLAFVFIVALGKFGISIAPFIAALGAVVFGGTMALQGSISNYGAGLTLILSRPFVVGDTIRINDVIGIVEEIKLSHTLLSNEDGEKIIIPNNRVVGEVIYNSSKNLIVEQIITISYDDDPDKVVQIIFEQLEKQTEVVSEPQAQVGIEKFSKTGIELGLRYWIPTIKYFELKYDINKQIYAALQAANITIPYQKQIIKLEANS